MHLNVDQVIEMFHNNETFLFIPMLDISTKQLIVKLKVHMIHVALHFPTPLSGMIPFDSIWQISHFG